MPAESDGVLGDATCGRAALISRCTAARSASSKAGSRDEPVTAVMPLGPGAAGDVLAVVGDLGSPSGEVAAKIELTIELKIELLSVTCWHCAMRR